MDCEYSRERQVAVLQLSDMTTAVVLRLNVMGRIPRSAAALLASARTYKAGVGVHDDAMALAAQHHGLRCNALLDLAAVAVASGVARGMRGLGELARDLLGVSKRESQGGWTRKTMGDDQAQYAAEDAWLSARIAAVMHENLRQTDDETLTAWCTRLGEESEPHVQRHTDFLERHESAARGATAAAPKRKRKELAEKRWKMAEDGYHRKRLEELRKRKEQRQTSDASVDDALQQLVEANAKPSKKRKQKQTKPDGDDGGGGGGELQLNLI
jgi:ribonuclease D